MDPQVFQIGGTEWLWIVLFVAILLFGSKKIPELARGIGKAMGEFQRGRAEIEREIRQAMEVTSTAPSVPASAPKIAASPPPAPKPVPATPTSVTYNTERKRLLDAAASLGIDPKGQTDEQLREAIKRAVG